MPAFPKPAALALATALALAGTAHAQAGKPDASQQQELDAARAELDDAAQRYAELARKYGGVDAPIRIEKRLLRKPVIGVLLAPDGEAGVRIAGVTPDSAAAAGGLKSGDRIVAIDGRTLKAADGEARVEETRALLSKLDAKTPVKLAYERDGKPQLVTLTPKVGDRLMVLPGGAMFDGNLKVFTGEDSEIEVLADRIRIDGSRPRAEWAPAIAPDVRTEIIRLGGDCKGEDCKLPAIAEAFRWSGLNLAAVDARLGRYFGTSEGVLVLSTGKNLEGLQPGDVIRRIGGKPVTNPREAMEALRAQPADARVAVEYLRDRSTAIAQVSVPKALPFSLPRAIAPGTAERRRLLFVGEDGKVQSWDDDGKAPLAWTARDGERVEKRKVVMIDKDGKRTEWEGDAGDPMPAWVEAMPKDGKRIEKRVQVIVDDNGTKTVIEQDGDAPAATRED